MSRTPDCPEDCEGQRQAEENAAWSMREIGRLRRERSELLEALGKLLSQVHADCLREGEEAVVEAGKALIARIEGG